ncbi:hypothetical protein LOZ53_001981 [Ophidiomyces ophidiicola]|nr:hypothetical protein LOZ54_001246 [Ophidiomyces ophidiicola]KAI1993925.1 hypothetical protein LOZ53_001981 [Ophidiomyces ophidiicola]KAI2003391.1 hypothetical protein LOZ51_000469 [Ophidiomyces ophidiicola]
MSDLEEYLDAAAFEKGLKAVDEELNKYAMVVAFAPIKLMAAGGFLAVNYLRNRGATGDIDYLLDPEWEVDDDIKIPLRQAIATVSSKLHYNEQWANEDIATFITKEAKARLFRGAVEQNIILFKGSNLMVLAAPIEWALERKLRRIYAAQRDRKAEFDMSDALALLKYMRDRNGGPLDRGYISTLNVNKFDVMPDASTMERIRAAYLEKYGENSSTSKPATGIGRPSVLSREAPTEESATSSGPKQCASNKDQEQPQAGVATSFRPFFALVEDTSSSRFYHPTVRYIFSDDDTDVITEAAMRSLNQQQTQHDPSKETRRGKGKKPDVEENEPDPSSLHHLYARKLPLPTPGTKQHFIILDIEPTGASQGALRTESPLPINPSSDPISHLSSQLPTPLQHPCQLPSDYKITSAHSLSSTWQVLNAQLAPAPTFDSPLNPNTTAKNPIDSDPFPGSGLMLSIEGTSGSSATKALGGTQGNNADEVERQTLEEMVELFETRMSELRKIVDASESGVQDREEGPPGKNEGE